MTNTAHEDVTEIDRLREALKFIVKELEPHAADDDPIGRSVAAARAALNGGEKLIPTERQS